MITMTPANSSWVRSVSYLPFAPSVKVEGCDGLLIVRSQTGKAYAYAVPVAIHHAFNEAQMKGESLGVLFNRIVRGKFQSVTIPSHT